MLNKVILIGHVGKDPEIKQANGKDFAVFSLATSERWKDKNSGERKEKTDWHRIVCFNEPLVNVIKNYVRTGSKLYLEGSLTTKKWTDDQGIERYSPEINLKAFNSTLVMLDKKDGHSSNTPPDDTYEEE